MIPPYTYAAARMAENRTNDTLRHGELARLISRAKPIRPAMGGRLLARVDRLLAVVTDPLRESCALFWSRSPACVMR